MAILRKIHFNSRNAEVDSVSSQILLHYQQSGLNEVPYLPEMMTRVADLQRQLNRSIKRINVKSELNLRDSERDHSLKSLNYFVFGQRHHFDPTIQQAAGMVYKVLENYGPGISRENYDSESALIDSLLLDLSRENLQTAINQLQGCAGLIAILREMQEAFKSAQRTYTIAKVKESEIANASQLRIQLRRYLNSLVLVYLNAMYLVDEPVYGPFVRVVGQAISENNRNVKRREGKREKVEDKSKK